MTEGSESADSMHNRWPKEVVSMALRALCKVWYSMEDEYFYGPGLPSTILDTAELPLLLSDPDGEFEYADLEKLSLFVGVIEGIDTMEELFAFMHEQQIMIEKARELQAQRMGMDIQESAEYRAKMTQLLNGLRQKRTGGEDSA